MTETIYVSEGVLKTEEEARKCWCPFVRVMNTKGEGGGNRWDQSGAPDDSPNGSLCIASACMAWRGDVHGYCGLAGKP